MPPPNRAITRATQAEMDALQNYDPTQPTTYSTGDEDTDLSNVLCILHPCSPTAFRIVEDTALISPQHVLQEVTESHFNDGLSQADLQEAETFVLNGKDHQPLDLALRFDSKLTNPALGFVFGRNAGLSDIVIGPDTVKHVSNLHFRIFVNQSGVCMLEDFSTNGTVVDNCVLKGKNSPTPATRMLNAGSIIEIVSPKADELVKFILRIPSREGRQMEAFTNAFNAYMQGVAVAQAQQGHRQEIHKKGNKAAYPRLVATGNLPMVRPPLIQNTWGMHWNGGDKYNVVGHLGKGAFANVYRLATKSDGQLFAAKELEKRRFMKNGILDRKLDNELGIMRNVDHPHIVQYVDYHDISAHLYIIMEYVPCGDLQQWLRAHGPLPEPLANKVAEQVFDALVYLHRKKITHRDIKPDNILIANDSEDGFTVKLSDFGLSKSVKGNETFLKTFCGTLLYCAPEVFPHYDDWLALNGKGGNKRKTRKASAPQRPKYHMYSPSVDIWSLGGVLWYAMCLKPPFEGVSDASGKGMFDRVMATPLDPTPLLVRGISDTAVDLLVRMLEKDPAERPTPEKCLVHPWFVDGALPEDSEIQQQGLGTIDEEDDEEIEEGEENGQEGHGNGIGNHARFGKDVEPDLSQLSLLDFETGTKAIQGSGKEYEELSFNSSDLELLDPRQSKRPKVRADTHRNVTSQPASEAQPPYDMAALAVPPFSTQPRPQHALFGEIKPSFLKSSGIFGINGHDQAFQPEIPMFSSSEYELSSHGHDDLFASAASRFLNEREGSDADRPNGDVSAYLQGAETDLRELNMDSPTKDTESSVDSPLAETNEPQTPRTPDNEPPQASLGEPGSNADETPKAADATPREIKYSRQISLPVSASFFYNPNDPSTHNTDYASSLTGYDFTNHEVMPAESFQSLSPTANFSEISPSSSIASEIVAPEPMSPHFIRPAPRLGRLETTAGSYTNIQMTLSARISSWGRATGNTFVYPDGHDTRVPKVGVKIYFHANGIEKAEKAGREWTKLPGLHCLLSTESSVGIRVNGVKLHAKNKEGRRLYGRVYTGDVITICPGPSMLEFECSFFHGEGKDRRPADGPRFHINKEEGSSQEGHE